MVIIDIKSRLSLDFTNVIDFKNIKDIQDVHNIFKDTLDFPDYYGNNLDALHDCMSDLSWQNKSILNIKIQNLSKVVDIDKDFTEKMILVLQSAENRSHEEVDNQEKFSQEPKINIFIEVDSKSIVELLIGKINT